MTTARDVIVKAIDDSFGRYSLHVAWELRDKIAELAWRELLSAPEPIRLNLAALLNPWRLIKTAPLNGTEILGAVILGWGPLILSWDDNEWRDQEGIIYEPTHWLPLPAPPSEDKT